MNNGWTRIACIDVLGIPKAQPRPRAFFNKKLGQARVYESGTAESWKSDIAIAAGNLAGMQISDPVRLCVSFMLPRPKYMEAKKYSADALPHVSKPDLDNLAKSTMDALTHIGVWKDDSQVCESFTTKQYVAKGRPSGALIQIFTREEV